MFLYFNDMTYKRKEKNTEMRNKNKYVYKGPVYKFGTIINENYQAETEAVTEKKALSNIQFRYKLSHDLEADAKITLKPSCLKQKI